MKRLQDRVAIITGGAGGIGAATAQRMAQEGALVVVADINLERAQSVANDLSGRGSAFQFDAGNTDSIKAMVEFAVAQYGRLDILHNNAALTSPDVIHQDSTAIDIPFETWNAVMNVNVKGYMAACKYAVPVMLKNGGGSIINTASGSGFVGDITRIAYGTSKGAVIALTKYIATQHGRQGIRCNAIAPGLILTAASEKSVPELLEIISNHVLTPRLGRPEDIAALAAFLASDEAGFINGETIRANGGSLEHQTHMHELDEFMRNALQS